MADIPADLRLPSPFHRLSLPLADHAGVALYLKRDDLIHPFVSGNKWRKLQSYIADAGKAGATRLASFGGAYSNHLLALAATGALLHMPVQGYVRGEQPATEGHMLRLCRLLGMEMVFLPRDEFADMKRNRQGMDISAGTYYIPEGGYGLPGLSGVAAIREELPFVPDHIITAVGTGTTLAGLAAAYAGTAAKIEGIVVLKGMDSLAAEVSALLQERSAATYVLHHQFHEGGYAKSSDRLLAFIRAFIRDTGILIDPVYTGKMLMATSALLEEGYFDRGSKVVCLHTGGTIGGLSLL
jgi:1-aminocyclopropane-1-carboxylate deaminase